MLYGKGKKGQLSVFIIIAIIIVASVSLYFLLRGKAVSQEIPKEFMPVESYFLSCIEERAEEGIEILESRGGYIYLPGFEPGSEYMPTSNQLNFLGTSVPYWYYLSGNNLVKEQVPLKTEMERQLENYIEENLDCSFEDFEEKGFEIELSEIEADVKISDVKVDVSVKADLDIKFGEQEAVINKHFKEIDSKLGRFYSEARKIYDYEKEEAFLENYAIDILRLYAPVDGVEISCSPKIWMKNEVDNTLKEALEANIQAIRFSSGEGYFNQKLQVGGNVRILYDRDWPTKIEIWNSNNDVLMAEPVGNQPGMGILGFCYVSYHFVYDVAFPVMIQLYDENEFFQFPVVVIIDKNKAREALPQTTIFNVEPELCKYPNTEISVYTYNNNLEPVEASISFECLGQSCDIGKTKIEGEDAVLTGKFPSCLNGYIIARADGYADKKYLISTNKKSVANIVLDRVYDLDLELRVNNQETDNMAIISFVSGESVQSVAWPEQKEVKLSEGLYNISVYVYREGSLNLPEMKKTICNEVPSSGLAGLFGMTEEKCIDIDIPAQKIENVISGGGKSEEYIVESQLEKGKIVVSVNSLPVPTTIEQLQDNYNLIEFKPVYLEFG